LAYPAGATLATLCDYVETRAREAVARDQHWQARVRGCLQWLQRLELAENVEPGVWKAVRHRPGRPRKANGASAAR